jgi:ankyrin repeat protein
MSHVASVRWGRFVLPAALFFAFSFVAVSDVSAQSLRWVRGGGNVPANAVEGGEDADGSVLYICRTTHNGTQLPGKVVGNKCNYNWGTTEYSSGNFEVLVGGGEYWSRRLDQVSAVAGGSSGSQTYYVCRAITDKGTHPGRMQDGKCNYGFGGRGYASTNYEVLNGNAPAAVSLLDAATRADAQGVRAALRSGQAINQKNTKGQTALMIAASKGANDVVRVLLNEGAAVDARDNEGFTALGYAAFQGDSQSVRQLLRAGANASSRTQAGYSPLYYAGASGDVETVRILLEESGRTDGGGSPLHGAAAYNRAEIIDYLADRDFDLDQTDANGYTALMVAARGNKVQAASALLRAGADVSVRTANNWEVFGLAASNNATDVMGLLMNSEKFGARSPAVEGGLRVAARDSKVPSINFLIQRGVNVNAAQNGVGTTPLMLAAANGHDDAIKALIAGRADVNLQNAKGETALILAASAGKKDAVKALLRAGADRSLTDSSGKTALQYATQNNHGDTRKELEKGGN